MRQHHHNKRTYKDTHTRAQMNAHPQCSKHLHVEGGMMEGGKKLSCVRGRGKDIGNETLLNFLALKPPLTYETGSTATTTPPTAD